MDKSQKAKQLKEHLEAVMNEMDQSENLDFIPLCEKRLDLIFQTAEAVRDDLDKWLSKEGEG